MILLKTGRIATRDSKTTAPHNANEISIYAETPLMHGGAMSVPGHSPLPELLAALSLLVGADQ
jgi:hypothetical protein